MLFVIKGVKLLKKFVVVFLVIVLLVVCFKGVEIFKELMILLIVFWL